MALFGKIRVVINITIIEMSKSAVFAVENCGQRCSVLSTKFRFNFESHCFYAFMVMTGRVLFHVFN